MKAKDVLVNVQAARRYSIIILRGCWLYQTRAEPEARIVNSREGYPVYAETPDVNWFVVQLANHNAEFLPRHPTNVLNCYVNFGSQTICTTPSGRCCDKDFLSSSDIGQPQLRIQRIFQAPDCWKLDYKFWYLTRAKECMWRWWVKRAYLVIWLWCDNSLQVT